VTDTEIQAVALAVRNAINPLDGDPIGVMIHNHPMLPDDVSIEAQMAKVDEVCRVIAEAAATALGRLHVGIKAAAYRRGFDDASARTARSAQAPMPAQVGELVDRLAHLKRMSASIYGPLINEASGLIQAQQKEAEKLNALVYVPGVWRCAKCGFSLTQMNLNAGDGTVTARDEPGTKCPNDGSPMWRVSYRDWAQEMCDQTDAFMERHRAELAAAQRVKDEALGQLSCCETILSNMAQENEGAIFNRWPISHEPLRADAKNRLPSVRAFLSLHGG
jgi:hypothetical protein